MTAIAEPVARASPATVTGRDYFSWSALSAYRSCPLRFYFRYIEGLPERVVGASLVFGGAIHAALQQHFEERLAGNPTPSVEALLGAYRTEWLARAGERVVRYGARTTIESLDRLAERMLAAFHASTAASPAGRVIGIEEELRGPLVPDVPDLLARVDLLVEEPDAVVLTDFKTSRSRWSPPRLEDAGEQLLLYHELARELVPDKPVRLRFVVITKGVEPAVETLDVPVDARRVERTRRVVERVWRAIEAEHFWPNPSPASCPTCPYREPCRRWQG